MKLIENDYGIPTAAQFEDAHHVSTQDGELVEAGRDEVEGVDDTGGRIVSSIPRYRWSGTLFYVYGAAAGNPPAHSAMYKLTRVNDEGEYEVQSV